MNYGKTAYLKVLDIEKELSQFTNNEEPISYFENTKLNINENINKNSSYKLCLDNVVVSKSKNILFQVKISLTANIEGEVSFELIIDDLIIHNEVRSVSKSHTDIIILKKYTTIKAGNLPVCLHIATESEDLTITINDITTVILGADNNVSSSDIELRALKINKENNIIVSYIDNNELFYLTTSLTEQSLKTEDFKFLAPSKSHCFCLESFANSEETVFLYRVDTDGKLYFSRFLTGEPEVFIDENVDVVYACPCPEVSDDFHIITYIKNGSCFYRTFKNDIISTEKNLMFPKDKYVDIRVVSKQDCEHIYVIATNQNGSNYILHSLVEVSTGKINEFLSASYSMFVSKYIDLTFLNKLSIENVSVNINHLIEAVSYVNQTIEKVSKSYLGARVEFSVEPYKLVQETTYGVKLDKSILTGTEWGSYTDDAVGFEGAYMDFSNDVFVDNDWMSRWPFSEIKPCVMNNGNVVGYVNPNNYNEFIDGSSSNISTLGFGYLMVEIPKIYYSITKDENNIYVKISNKAKSGFVCTSHVYKGVELNKIYVSAYLCGKQNMPNYGFKTESQTSLASSSAIKYALSYGYLKKYDGERFEFMPYNVLKLLQCLFIIMFKSTNSQVSLGYGYKEYQKNHIVGLLDQKGMNYGKQSAGTGVKFLGLEDIYACRSQLVTGFRLDANLQPKFIDVYNPNMSYHPDYINDYIGSTLPFVKGSRYHRSAIDINEDGNNIGFFASDNSTDKTLGFCDGCQMVNSETAAVDFGYAGATGDNMGMFAQSLQLLSSATNNRSIRLVYFPEE